MSVMARSLGAHPDLFRVEVVKVLGIWHRRARLGAFGWWVPEGCHWVPPIQESRPELPETESVCRICWPAWPKKVSRAR